MDFYKIVRLLQAELQKLGNCYFAKKIKNATEKRQFIVEMKFTFIYFCIELNKEHNNKLVNKSRAF